MGLPPCQTAAPTAMLPTCNLIFSDDSCVSSCPAVPCIHDVDYFISEQTEHADLVCVVSA